MSYLLASPTLNAVALVGELDGLLKRLGRGPVTILYTNAAGTDANRSFLDFHAALHGTGFAPVAGGTGSIEISRRTGTRDRRLRYALFQRRRQDTLPLG